MFACNCLVFSDLQKIFKNSAKKYFQVLRFFPFKRSVLKKCRWDNPSLYLRFLCFRQGNRMFSWRETYVFHIGNIRFTKGKHRKCRESLEKMYLRCEFSEALFVMLLAKIMVFMVDWWFHFLRFRMFFWFIAFVKVISKKIFPCFCCFLYRLGVYLFTLACIIRVCTCTHVRVHTPARNT